jgi:hypothetical protein
MAEYLIFCHSVQYLLSSHLLSKNINIRIYKTIILPLVLSRCETLSLTIREEPETEGVCEYLDRRDEVTGGCNKLHEEKHHNLYSSPSIIRMIKSWRMKWARHVGQMREKWM